MLNLNSIMIGSKQPKELADFYSQVLGKQPDMVDDGWYGFNAGGCFLTIGEHSEVDEAALEPQRIILNFETDDVQGEFNRLKELGATVVAEPYAFEEGEDVAVATMADIDGNFFQLMAPWEEEAE